MRNSIYVGASLESLGIAVATYFWIARDIERWQLDISGQWNGVGLYSAWRRLGIRRHVSCCACFDVRSTSHWQRRMVD